MDRDTLVRITQARAKGESIVVATRLDTAETRLVSAQNAGTDELIQAAREASARDQSGSIKIDGHTWFLNVFNSPPCIYIVGAVHIAQPLSQMAAIAGFNVVVIDPRTAFATSERFPNLHLVTAWPDEALADLPIDRRTAIVTLTHDPKLDDPALIAALHSECFYIGALGSRKTHAARKERMKAAGFSDEAFNRINGPVGLSIGAVSPAEIAVSIMAQIVERLRQKNTP
ncbi:MAG: XdhC family protein [Micropepsaceae bacterium]